MKSNTHSIFQMIYYISLFIAVVSSSILFSLIGSFIIFKINKSITN